MCKSAGGRDGGGSGSSVDVVVVVVVVALIMVVVVVVLVIAVEHNCFKLQKHMILTVNLPYNMSSGAVSGNIKA